MVAGNYKELSTERKLEIANHTIARLTKELEEAEIRYHTQVKETAGEREHSLRLANENAALKEKVERVTNEILGLLEYFDCIEEGDQTEEERNFVADLTRMQKILER